MSSTQVESSAPSTPGRRATTWHRDALAAVGRWSWLQDLNDRVTAAVDPVYDRHRGDLLLELMHGGRWVGHSLHPALSDLPIGLWSSILVLDLTGEDTGDGGRLGPAATLSAAGLLASGATAATGVVDWNVSDGEDRRVGLFHGLLNAAGMVLQGASLAARLSGRRGAAATLGAGSLGVMAAAGFVGGHLVQGRAVMVNRVATTTGPSRWVRAIEDADLPDATPVGREVEGRAVLLYRLDGEVHALDDVCSHAGALLSRGEVENCAIVCPLHRSAFDLRDGSIVRGPAHHPQPVLPARVRNGWVEVRGSQPRSRRKST